MAGRCREMVVILPAHEIVVKQSPDGKNLNYGAQDFVESVTRQRLVRI
jgi:hypothetical protein